MIWKTLIEILVRQGMTQREIAEAVGCSQTTVSELAISKTTDPRSSTAFGLLRLAKKRGIQIQMQDSTPSIAVPPSGAVAGSDGLEDADRSDRRKVVRRREDQVDVSPEVVTAALAIPDQRQIGRFTGGRRETNKPGRRASDRQTGVETS